MVNQPLRIHAIQKLIASQEKTIADYESEILSLNSRKEELEIGIELIRQYLQEPRNQLEALGATSLVENTSFQRSSKQTLKFIQESNDPLGMPIKAIIEKYSEVNIVTHSRNIIEHLNELEITNKVYQTNPGIQKGRRYKPVETVTASLEINEVSDTLSENLHVSPPFEAL